ncbi:MAG: OmpA family protein [Elusimicrobia bacterium]|nr:OmpA family protein [Elusimicrobiota bacterium]
MIPFLHRVSPESMEENPLWLIVLCDMMTNLMLFFLAMFALTLQGAEAKASFERAFRAEEAVVPAPPVASPEPSADPETALRRALEAAGLAAEVELQRTERGVRVRLRDAMLFPTAGAVLEPGAALPLGVIARALKGAPHEVVVEGHTDDRPVLGGQYRSNWELSVARSHAVLERLAAEGLAPGRLVAAGYGEFLPSASNATPEGRAANRRVELLVLRPEED